MSENTEQKTTTEIVKIDPNEFGLEESKASEIAAQFKPMLDKMVELEKEYNEIIVKPIDEDTVKAAKSLRQKYVKVRTGTAEIHKVQKEFYLKGGRFVDGWKNAQLFASQGIEDKLEAIEKHFERLEQDRINKLREEREAIAILFGVDVNTVALGIMTEDVWNNFLLGAKESFRIRKEAEEQVEKDRIEKELKERVYQQRKNELAPYTQFIEEGEGISVDTTHNDFEIIFDLVLKRKEVHEAEQEQIRIDNLRLKKEADEKEAALEKERAEALAKQKEIEDKAKAELDEAKRIADEKEAALKAENDRIAKELSDKKEAEEKIQRDIIAAEKKAKSASDKVKLSELAKVFSAVQMPEVKSDEAEQIIRDVEGLVLKLTNFINQKIEKL